MDFKQEFIKNKFENWGGAEENSEFWVLRAYMALETDAQRAILEGAFPDFFQFPEIRYCYSWGDWYISSAFSEIKYAQDAMEGKGDGKILRMTYENKILTKVEVLAND